jgi:hypothetical protein
MIVAKGDIANHGVIGECFDAQWAVRFSDMLADPDFQDMRELFKEMFTIGWLSAIEALVSGEVQGI